MGHPQGAPTTSAYIWLCSETVPAEGRPVNGFCGLFNARVRTTLSLRPDGRSVGRNKPAVRGSTGCTLNLDESKRSNSKNKPELNDLPSVLTSGRIIAQVCKPLCSSLSDEGFNQPLRQERSAGSLPAHEHRTHLPREACLLCRIALAAVPPPPSPLLQPPATQMHGRSRPF